MRGSKLVTLGVLVAGIVLGAIGHGFLAAGMRRVGSPSASLGEVLGFAWRTIREPRVVAGVALQACFLASYLFALSRADLSFVLPITALDFILTALVASLWLGERLTPARWLGAAFVAAGIALVAWTDASTRP